MTLFDNGLQAERTELAWRRTSLALGVGSLVAFRLLPTMLDSHFWALAGVGGFVMAAAVYLGARRRYRTVHARQLASGARPVLPGAGLMGVLVAFVTALGIAAVVAVITAAAA